MKIYFDDVAQPSHRGIAALAVICRSPSASTAGVAPSNRLVGYFRLEVDRLIESATLGIRAVAFERLKMKAVHEGENQFVLQPAALPFRHVWAEKGTIYDVSGSQWVEISDELTLEKGSYTFGFTLHVPNHLPSTGESWLGMRNYQLRVSVLGKDPGAWLGLVKGSVEESASREFLVSAHPSSEGLEKLNPLDVRLMLNTGPPTDEEDVLKPRISVRTPNARYGGCFDLHISLRVPEGMDTHDVSVSYEVHLRQHWQLEIEGRTNPLKGIDQTANLTLPREGKNDIIVSTLHLSDFTSTPYDPTPSPSTRPSLDGDKASTPPPPADPQTSNNLTTSANLHFPNENSGFYPSTLPFTKVSVSFKHTLSCKLKISLPEKTQVEYDYDANVCLVGPDMATESLLLPPY